MDGMSADFEKHIDEAIANAGGDLCKLLEIAAASSSDQLADDEHLAQNVLVLVLCERAAIAIKSLQKRSLMFMREREEARAELAAERERVKRLEMALENDDGSLSSGRVTKLREALEDAAIALDGWDDDMARRIRAALKETSDE